MFIRSLLGAAAFALSSGVMATSITPSQVGNLGVGDNEAPAGWLTVNYGSDLYPNIGLIQFDLSAYAGDTVASATLDLYHQYNYSYGATFALYANTEAWVPRAGNVSDGPSFLPTPVAEFTITDGNTGVWRSADVTTIVNDWTHGLLPNYGLTLERVDAANPFAYFTSGLNHTPSPSLTFDVSAVPEPANAVLLLAGLAGVGLVLRRRNAQA